jgi:hypothetical protein
MPEIAYVVTEVHTRIILFFAPSRLTATSLAKGMLNTVALEFVVHENFESDWVNDVDRELDILHLYQAHSYPVKIKMISDYPGKEEVYRKRKLLKLRSRYLYDLELLCETQLTRTAGFDDHSLLSFVRDQLKQCDFSQDFYTSAIQEYADINEISADVAYQELCFRTEAADLIKFRVQAFYDRYSQMLTNLTQVEEFDRAMAQCRQQLLGTAYA